MPKIPFPHVLTFPKNNWFPPKGETVRLVSDQKPEDIQFSTSIAIKGDAAVGTFKIKEVLNSRPARGDWSKWDKAPTYYECSVEQIDYNPAIPKA